MTRGWLRSAVVPAYLLACLLLGGSRQGVWTNAALQLLALLLLAWAAAARRDEPTGAAGRQLLALALAAVLLVVAQLIPMPPGIWSSLPGRQMVERGFAFLGQELPWLPLSLAPHDTLEAGYALLPPLAVIAAMLALRGYRESWIAGVVLAGALASVLLGAVQVASGGTGARLYEVTNVGAVGFFANKNHMATLLLAAIPFAGALFAVAQPQVKSRSKAFAMLALGAGGFLLVLAGLVLNDSLAALALSVPVIAMTGLILPLGWRARWLILPLAGLALAAAVAALGTSSVGSAIVDSEGVELTIARAPIWEATSRLIGETFPAGTGFGSFPHVYQLHEDPSATDRSFINHAHNDYLELALEAGLPGLFLLGLFLLWWPWHALRIWRSPVSSQFAKAAAIASGAILAHSIVDYPLRTSAIAALFAACLGLMARARARASKDEPQHVTIG